MVSKKDEDVEETKMTKTIITCDCMQPQVIPIWKKTWDQLKKDHPKLKVNVFVVPYWKELPENDVFRNKDFEKWYEERKDWVEIGQMGYHYLNQLECLRFKNPQYAYLRRGYRKVGCFMPKDIYCFKPPKQRMNEHTLPILRSLGFSACIYNKEIIMLRKTEKPLNEYIMVETSINIDSRSPDNINLLQTNFNNYFTKVEQEGNEYITASELIRGALN